MDSAIRDKSKLFAIRIVKLYRYLCSEKKNISSQNNYCAVAQVLEPMLLKHRLLSVKKNSWLRCISHLKSVMKLSIGLNCYMIQNISLTMNSCQFAKITLN